MLKNLKKAQLARVLGVANGSISMAVTNKKLILNSDKTINITHPFNKMWIDGQVAQGKIFDLNLIMAKPKKVAPKPKPKKKKVKSKTKKENPVDDDNFILHVNNDVDEAYDPQLDLAAKKIELELQKLTAEIRLKNLEIEKKEGLLIPTDAVNSVIIFIIETYRTTYVQDMNNIANIYTQMLGANQQQFVDIRKRIAEAVKDSSETAKEMAINGIDGIVNEYSDTRGRGEKR